jgi:D-alanyl-lipoteichoic acid acyltransferase DltB (MBOAT superfamily)
LYFDSLQYILFVPAVLAAYQLMPPRWRWAVLLSASIAFYAALRAPLLVVAWALVVLTSYWLGLRIFHESNGLRRRRYLWAGVAAQVVILGGIKYLRPLFRLIVPGFETPTGSLDWFSTLGISYYTLQAVSYLVDVYLGTAEPERHFGRFALYLGFFPKMLQGPIERAGDLLPQLRSLGSFNYANVRSGVLLFCWGLFKKVAVANRLAPFVTAVYYDPHGYSGLSLIAATYMYALQILADFSGYTDMALGVARMFNIRLTENFKSPYFATSIADFWRRWHISFSRWILDYIFKPLQIEWRNARKVGVVGALMVTFLFSGLWHGVALTFLAWGLLHGVYLASSVLLKPWREAVCRKIGLANHSYRRVFQGIVTFQLVAFAWIFFRARSIADGWYIATHLFGGAATRISYATAVRGGLMGAILNGGSARDFAMLGAAMTVWLLGSSFRKTVRLQEQPIWFRWSTYYALILALVFLSAHDDVGFVYFQF